MVLANCLKQVVCSNLVVADQVYQFSGRRAGRQWAPDPAGAEAWPAASMCRSAAFPHLPSSVGRVVFGVFKSGPVLYLREMY